MTYRNPVYTMEGKEVVLVMASRGGKHEVKVFAEPYRYPDAPYSLKNFVREQGAMKQTGGGSGYDLLQMLMRLAKIKYLAKSEDNINYIVKYDDLDFTQFYDDVMEGMQGKRKSKRKSNPRTLITDEVNWRDLEQGNVMGYSAAGDDLWSVNSGESMNPEDDSGQWLWSAEDGSNRYKWFDDVDDAVDHAEDQTYDSEIYS